MTYITVCCTKIKLIFSLFTWKVTFSWLFFLLLTELIISWIPPFFTQLNPIYLFHLSFVFYFSKSVYFLYFWWSDSFTFCCKMFIFCQPLLQCLRTAAYMILSRSCQKMQNKAKDIWQNGHDMRAPPLSLKRRSTGDWKGERSVYINNLDGTLSADNARGVTKNWRIQQNPDVQTSTPRRPRLV